MTREQEIQQEIAEAKRLRDTFPPGCESYNLYLRQIVALQEDLTNERQRQHTVTISSSTSSSPAGNELSFCITILVFSFFVSPTASKPQSVPRSNRLYYLRIL
jgi:hypothetical protein